VLFDADPECLGNVHDTVSGSGHRTLSLPYALGAQPGRRIFHFNVNPYSNSFLQLNPYYGTFFEYQAGRDYVMADVLRAVKDVELDVRTVDSLTEGAGDGIPQPDFLMVDTEGADYEVLTGARASLSSRGLAVSVESQFQPIFKNQHLFGDVCRLMDRLGFDLASVYPHPGHEPCRTSIGLRGRTFHTSCDALFLRRIESLASMAADPETRWLRIQKLAFVAFLLGHVAYGIKALASAKGIKPNEHVRAAACHVSYMAFLNEIEKTILRMPERLPPLFPDVPVSRDRDSTVHPRSDIRIREKIRRALAPYPRAIAAIRVALRLSRSVAGRVHEWSSVAIERMRRPPQDPSDTNRTEFESVLARYGLKEVSDIVRNRRVAEEPFAVQARVPDECRSKRPLRLKTR
jgi:FkbM family methyltransferase